MPPTWHRRTLFSRYIPHPLWYQVVALFCSTCPPSKKERHPFLPPKSMKPQIAALGVAGPTAQPFPRSTALSHSSSTPPKTTLRSTGSCRKTQMDAKRKDVTGSRPLNRWCHRPSVTETSVIHGGNDNLIGAQAIAGGS
jgi:hypothetical protein